MLWNFTDGFVPLSKTGAELLFEVISQRYERSPIIIGGFHREAQRFKQSGLRRPCQAPTGTPRRGIGSRGICAA